MEETVQAEVQAALSCLEYNTGRQVELEDWRHELEERIERLKTSETYRAIFSPGSWQAFGGKLMLPGRMSTLSMLEEEAGAKATWRDFAAALWLAAFGDENDSEKVLASPIEFMETGRNWL